MKEDYVGKKKVIGYYRIRNTHQIAKKTGAMEYWEPNCNGDWIPEKRHEFSDREIGYDPSEPIDSPYGIGCTDIMHELEKISFEEFQKEYNTYYKKK